eukprot:181122-Amphidinium_carterae.2
MDAYKSTHEGFDKPMDEALFKTAESLAQKAYVTKASVVLLYFFDTETSKVSLRDKVKLEVKGLRSKELHEKDVLHPALAQHVQLALAMRS